MDGSTDGLLDRKIGGWMDGWMDGRNMAGWMDRSIHRHTYGQTDKQREDSLHRIRTNTCICTCFEQALCISMYVSIQQNVFTPCMSCCQYFW